MGVRRQSWMEAFGGLGEAVLGLLQAEMDVVREGWQRWAVELGKILAMAMVALLVLVYLPFLAMFAAVDGIHNWLGWAHWSAALAVLGLAVLGLALLAAIASYIYKKRMVSPVETLRRRLDDPRGWWQQQVFFESPEQVEDPGHESVG